MLLNDKVADKIKENRMVFEDLLARITSAGDLDTQVYLAKKAIKIAVDGSTGYYSSDIVENVFLAQAALLKKQSLTKGNDFFQDVLHVVTECYEVGGHTRVIEQWINFALDDEVHSVIFTEGERRKVPQRLWKLVSKKNGKIYFLNDCADDIAKAVLLRDYATRSKRVVLHTHMHDVVPLIAFGSNAVQCPVIHYNHADHRFWLGVSIADAVAETRSFGKKLSLEKRGVQKSQVVGIPFEVHTNNGYDKIALRRELDIPQDTKVVITIGTAHKYKPLGELDFLNAIKPMLDADQKIILLAVGPDFKKLPNWKEFEKQYEGRVLALGNQPHSMLSKYICASDLALDSFPMSGGTALGEITMYECPVLALECPTGHLDYIYNTSAYCKNVCELVDKGLKLLKNPLAAQKNAYEVKAALMKISGKEKWREGVARIYKLAGDTHKIHSFITPRNYALNDLDAFLYVDNLRINRKINIRNVFSLYTVKENGKKKYIFQFFNKTKNISEKYLLGKH